MGTGFRHDVRQIGHFGTGDLEITIKTEKTSNVRRSCLPLAMPRLGTGGCREHQNGDLELAMCLLAENEVATRSTKPLKNMVPARGFEPLTY